MRSASGNMTSIFSQINATRGIELGVQNGKAVFRGRANSSTVIATSQPGTTTVTDGEWHYLTGVLDGTSWKIYVDGVLESSQNNTGSITPLSSTALIGRSLISTTYFNGEIKDVGYWNYAKTQSEIVTDMQTSYSSPQTGMLGYWPLSVNVSPTPDMAAVPHNGNAVSGVSYSADKRYLAVVLMESDYYPFGISPPTG